MINPQPSVLARLAQATRQRVATYQQQEPLPQLQQRALAMPPAQDFAAAFRQPDLLHILAEIKRASPSQGAIAPHLEAVDVARQYLSQGARALSVLTEPQFFGGQPQDLLAVRSQFPQALLLMKDFLLDPYQLYLARACGADACLLMASLLAPAELAELYGLALELGLTPLLEVHDAAEMAQAQALGAQLIGINNRNLKTLHVDLELGVSLLPLAPAQAVLICESGLSQAAELVRMRQLGFDGFLIGSSLMRGGQPGRALQTLLQQATALQQEAANG